MSFLCGCLSGFAPLREVDKKKGRFTQSRQDAKERKDKSGHYLLNGPLVLIHTVRYLGGTISKVD